MSGGVLPRHPGRGCFLLHITTNYYHYYMFTSCYYQFFITSHCSSRDVTFHYCNLMLHCRQLMHSRDGHVPDEQWEVMGSFLTTYYFQILSLLHVYFFLLWVFITSYCSSIVPAVLLYCPARACHRRVRHGLSDSSTQRGSSSWHVFHSRNIQVGCP